MTLNSLRIAHRFPVLFAIVAITSTLAMPAFASSSTHMATIGHGIPGAHSASFNPNRKSVNRYWLPTAGQVVKLSIYLSPTSISGQQQLQGVIYADRDGRPSRLLAMTAELVFRHTDSAGWYDLSLPAPMTLPAGPYWIGVLVGGTPHVAAFRFDRANGSRRYNHNFYGDGPSARFGSSRTFDEQVSLTATYLAVPGVSVRTHPPSSAHRGAAPPSAAPPPHDQGSVTTTPVQAPTPGGRPPAAHITCDLFASPSGDDASGDGTSDVVAKIAAAQSALTQTAAALAQLDVLVGLATIAERRRYTRPRFSAAAGLHIKGTEFLGKVATEDEALEVIVAPNASVIKIASLWRASMPSTSLVGSLSA